MAYWFQKQLKRTDSIIGPENSNFSSVFTALNLEF